MAGSAPKKIFAMALQSTRGEPRKKKKSLKEKKVPEERSKESQIIKKIYQITLREKE